jgi:hypothetical protein
LSLQINLTLLIDQLASLHHDLSFYISEGDEVAFTLAALLACILECVVQELILETRALDDVLELKAKCSHHLQKSLHHMAVDQSFVLSWDILIKQCHDEVLADIFVIEGRVPGSIDSLCMEHVQLIVELVYLVSDCLLLVVHQFIAIEASDLGMIGLHVPNNGVLLVVTKQLSDEQALILTGHTDRALHDVLQSRLTNETKQGVNLSLIELSQSGQCLTNLASNERVREHLLLTVMDQQSECIRNLLYHYHLLRLIARVDAPHSPDTGYGIVV